MRKLLFAGLWPPPPLGTRLWLTLGSLAVVGLNLVYEAEIWPHTLHAEQVLTMLGWLLLLVVVPQALWWAWNWLRVYTGPVWMRLTAKALFMSGVCVAAAIWVLMLVILVGGTIAMLFKL